MANNLLTISMITREAIDLFVNSNAFIKNIDRQYDSEFGKSGEKIGSQLRIRLPNDYVVSDGPALQLQSTNEQQTVLTMATQRHVDVSFTSADMYLSLDDFSERILLPMMNNLAGNVAKKIMNDNAPAICNMAANFDAINNNILTPNADTYLDAQATLSLNSTPQAKQKIMNNPRTEARVVASLTGLLNPNSAISEQYYEGVMYRALGATWFSDQTVITHTAGTFTAGTVSGADQTGPVLDTNAITGTLVAGDIITIDNVFAVNRVNKESYAELRQFVVLENVDTAGTEISIYPPLIPAVGGQEVQYQTVTVSPANGAPISLYTNPSQKYRLNFRYVPQAITMATGDLPIPNDVKSARHRYDNVSMRAVTQYIIGTDQSASRLDTLFGSLLIRPEWACKVPDRI